MPVDFFGIVQFRMYLDSIEETLSYYENISEPYNYVKYTPSLFNKWCDWARGYKAPENDSSMRSFGEKVGPDWMKGEFVDLKGFYEHYTDIILN